MIDHIVVQYLNLTAAFNHFKHQRSVGGLLDELSRDSKSKRRLI